MMPMQPPSGMMPTAGAGGPPQNLQGTPPAPADQQPNPDTVKRQLTMLLAEAKKLAEQNGLNWTEIVQTVEKSAASAKTKPASPPAITKRPTLPTPQP
jgi:hypothetical protein